MPARHPALPSLSQSQREIMEIVWDRGEVSAVEVRAILASKRALAKNTVRTLLERMEAKGWIKAEWAQSDNNRKAKYYSLTKAGRKQLEAEQQNWEQLSAVIANVLQNA